MSMLGNDREREIMEQLRELNYDRWKIESDVMGAMCYLWKEGETVASITKSGPTILMAITHALYEARAMTAETVE